MNYSRLEHAELIAQYLIVPFLIFLFLVSFTMAIVRWVFEFNYLYSHLDYGFLWVFTFFLTLAFTVRMIDVRVRLLFIKDPKNILAMKLLLGVSITIFSLGFQQWTVERNIDEKQFPTVDIRHFDGWDKVKYIKIRDVKPYYDSRLVQIDTKEWRSKGHNSGLYIEFLATHLAPLDFDKNIWISEVFEENLRAGDVDLNSDVISFSERTINIFKSRDYNVFSYFEVLKPSSHLRFLESKVKDSPVPVFVRPVSFSYEKESKKGVFHLLYMSIPVFISIVVLFFFRVNTDQMIRFQKKTDA